LNFELLATDGAARAGTITTAHGTVETPIFMPVGTQATVKGLTPEMVRGVGAQIILGNTYHLTLRPGDELIRDLGGLHTFMNWPHPILTDSGAEFRSHLDGRLLELTPEKAVEIQQNLGSDIAMVLDECPPADASPDLMREAIRRTIHWAERCKAHHTHPTQAQFAIVQGGLNVELRGVCAEALIPMDFPGYALGGFSVGETPEAMHAALPGCAALLPVHKPRYLMGVGRPQDLLVAVAAGIDMFDCVMPTRSGRNALAFTDTGTVKLRNAKHRRDPAPLMSGCECDCCAKYSRAYLHHLFNAGEMLGPMLLSLHNLAYYLRVMRDARTAIVEGRFAAFAESCVRGWEATP
jgi:queuine tRNA-ribosyltransferase